MYTQDDVGQNCKQCSTGKITQFRSGKIGCSNWQNHKKQDTRVPSTTSPEPLQRPQANLNATPDVYDLLTTIVAQNNKILEILNKEMPTDPFNEA
jgi:hypothetical protein